MFAGIPGTGISGLYYLALAFLMPFRELYLLCRGRSSLQRWGLVLMQVLNAAGILWSLAIAAWLLKLMAIEAVQITHHHHADPAAIQRIQSTLTASYAWVTIGVLITVVVTVELVGEAMLWKQRLDAEEAGVPSAPAAGRVARRSFS